MNNKTKSIAHIKIWLFRFKHNRSWILIKKIASPWNNTLWKDNYIFDNSNNNMPLQRKALLKGIVNETIYLLLYQLIRIECCFYTTHKTAVLTRLICKIQLNEWEWSKEHVTGQLCNNLFCLPLRRNGVVVRWL